MLLVSVVCGPLPNEVIVVTSGGDLRVSKKDSFKSTIDPGYIFEGAFKGSAVKVRW